MEIWIDEKTHTVYVEDAGKKFTSYAVHSAMIHYIKEYTKKTRTPYEGVSYAWARQARCILTCTSATW